MSATKEEARTAVLRKPNGPYQVSVCQIDTDYFGDNEFRRKLPLMFFYPSEGGTEMCPYMDAAYQKSAANGQPMDNGVNTYCYLNGRLSSEESKYPVVIYNHGLMGYQMDSTVLCADIASEGYVVVSVGHPFGAGAVTYASGEFFADGINDKIDERKLNALGDIWKGDIYHAIDYLQDIAKGENRSPFQSRLEMSSGVHLIGVSFGGCCSVAAALQDSRVIDAVNLDGGLFVELNPLFKDKPILTMRSYMNYKANHKLDKIGCVNVKTQRFRNVTHWEFSDGVYLSSKGKNNREWADRVSTARADRCLAFWKEHS